MFGDRMTGEKKSRVTCEPVKLEVDVDQVNGEERLEPAGLHGGLTLWHPVHPSIQSLSHAFTGWPRVRDLLSPSLALLS